MSASNLITVPQTVWTDEVFMRCPGATLNGVEQALLSALTEFCQQSGAWRVELWSSEEDESAGTSTDPKPFNLYGQPFYDLQAILNTFWQAAQGVGDPYASGDPVQSFTGYHTISDYWPWTILYIHHMSFFAEYEWSPTEQEYKADRFVYPSQTPHHRAPSYPTTNEQGEPMTFTTFNERPSCFKLQPEMEEDAAGVVPWISLGFRRKDTISGGAEGASNPLVIPDIFERHWYEIILDGVLGKMLSQQDKPYTNPVLGQYHGRRFRKGIAEARDMGVRTMNNAERTWHYPAWA